MINSASICDINSTMSSTGQNSYFLGSTFGGCSSGLARFSDELSVELADAADGWAVCLASRFGLMELRRLTGERAAEAVTEDVDCSANGGCDACCGGGAGAFTGGDVAVAAVPLAMACGRGDGGGCEETFCEDEGRRPEADSESMDAWRMRREDTGDVTDTPAEEPDRDEARRSVEERGADGGGSTQMFEDDAWRKLAAAGDALAELLSIGDVFNMVCGTLWRDGYWPKCSPTLFVKGFGKFGGEKKWRGIGPKRNKWESMGEFVVWFVDGLKYSLPHGLCSACVCVCPATEAWH